MSRRQTSAEDVQSDVQLGTSSRNTSQTILKASAIYRPIISLLRFSGSFYFCSTKSDFTFNRALQIFCYFVQLIVVSGTIRYLSVFRNATDEMYEMVGLLAFLWYYICETSSSIGFLYLNNKHIMNLCISIDTYWEKYGMETNIPKTCKLIRILSFLSVILSIIYQVIFVSSYFIHGVYNTSLISSLFTPFEGEKGATYIMVFVIITLVNILYHGIIFSNILFVLINMYIFTTEFKGIRNKVRRVIEENNLKKLTQLRIQHQDIASVQDTANLIFRFTVLNVYFFGLPIVCLMLYGATSRRFETADVMAMLSTLIGAVIGMFLLTFIGAQLNQTAHEPLQDLYRVDTSNSSDRTIAELQLFISRLTGSSIGINVYGLFVIDHNAILMVFGTIISYAVIVVQFNQSTISCQCVMSNSTNQVL